MKKFVFLMVGLLFLVGCASSEKRRIGVLPKVIFFDVNYYEKYDRNSIGNFFQEKRNCGSMEHALRDQMFAQFRKCVRGVDPGVLVIPVWRNYYSYASPCFDVKIAPDVVDSSIVTSLNLEKGYLEYPIHSWMAGHAFALQWTAREFEHGVCDAVYFMLMWLPELSEVQK